MSIKIRSISISRVKGLPRSFLSTSTCTSSDKEMCLSSIVSCAKILPSIKCYEEGVTIIQIKMNLMKLSTSLQSYFALLRHEKSLLNLLEAGIENLDEKVGCLCSLVHLSLLQLQRRIPVVKYDLTILLEQSQSLENSLRQYSYQNNSLGYELDTAGFPMLAKEKYELAQKEIEICDKISLIQRLGKLDLLTIDSPDFEALQTLFTSMKSVEEHGEDSFYLAEQNGDINNSKIEDVNEEHPAKRQRISNSHSDVAVGCIDDIDQSQPIYTHTATEGDWQSPEKAILEISFPSDSVSLTTTVHEKSCHGDDQVDQSVIGAVSQDADNASVTKTNELNLSAISNSSSINGSSLIHSTPSPELISQHHQNFRRYHSDGVDRRNLSREYDSDHQYPPPNQSKGGLVHEKEENGDLLTRRSITQ